MSLANTFKKTLDRDLLEKRLAHHERILADMQEHVEGQPITREQGKTIRGQKAMIAAIKGELNKL